MKPHIYYLKTFSFIFLLLLLAGVNRLCAQQDTSQVEILSHTKRLTLQTIDDTTRLTIITGNVKLRQGTTLLFCDSCVINNTTKIFEAWGNVRINDSDTANIYSNHMLYYMQRKVAYFDGNVRLTDGHGTLTTPQLEYDLNTNIGIYKKGGRVVNKKTVLTSNEGIYFADMKDIYFKGNVVLKDPSYDIVTDSLLYNTELQTTRFISYTVITDSTGRVIKTREGFVNQLTGQAEFGLRPEIIDGKTSVRADRITNDDKTKMMIAEGNAIVVDTAQGTTIIGGIIMRNTETDAILATRKPLMIVRQENDSIYIKADTLFSARLTDLYGIRDSIVVDTIKGTKVASLNNKDSTNRYFEAFRNVKIFNDSLQASCDSMFYSFKDSTFRLFDDPVVWAQNSQITGDTINVYTKNKKADHIEAFENSFMVNRLDDQAFNQVKSTRLDGYFVNGNIDSVRANGFVECIYFLQDEDSAYTGINETRAEIMDVFFKNKELYKVVFRTTVTGTLWPIKQKSPTEMKLPNFRWLEDRRPKSRLEMYE